MGGHVNFILGVKQGRLPTKRAQKGCHCNARCVAMAPGFIAEYFNNAKGL